MPYIRVITTEKEVSSLKLLEKHKNAIRITLNAVFPEYAIEHIVLIPEIVPEKHIKYSENLLPLEFVFDIGSQNGKSIAGTAERLEKQLITFIPDLDNIHFGLWIKEMQSNDFVEHKPTPS